MSAKENDLLRIQEIYDVATLTLAQLEELGLAAEQFVAPGTTQEELIAEGLANRVFRVAEEGGKLSEMFKAYGFELREMSGLRNRLAHAYGSIDMALVWGVVEGCERYCEDNGVALLATWREEAPEMADSTGKCFE